MRVMMFFTRVTESIIGSLNLTLDTVEYVLILEVKYQIIRYIIYLTPPLK